MHPLLRPLKATADTAPLVVGHRGSAATHPENTQASFAAAAAIPGVAMIEFDVRQSRDGIWVCIHDPDGRRTTDAAAVFADAARAIEALTFAELRRLRADAASPSRSTDAAAACPVPTLAEALDAIPTPIVPMIERKAGDAFDLARTLASLGATDRVLVQAFDWSWLEAFRAAAPRIALGALANGALTTDRVAEARRLGVDLLHWRADDLTATTCAELTAGAELTCVYTVDDELGWLGASHAGIDAVVTNDPRRMASARARGALDRRR